MTRSLTLPDELFNKLANGAAQRGLTLEALLTFVSDLVALPNRPTERDLERGRCIERLLAKYRNGPLTDGDRADLDRLIDADYREAVARADRIIAAGKSHPHARSPRAASVPHVRSSPKPVKRSRK
jgi:hypothetical protein